MFSCEYCEIFKNKFLVKHFLYYTSLKCYVMTEMFKRLWTQNWRFSYSLYYCFVFLHNSCPWLFGTYFHTKIFSKRNSCTRYNVGSSTILVKSLKIRNNCRILATSLSNLLWKCQYEFFEYYALLLFFFRSCLAVVAKNNPTKKINRCSNSGDIKASASVKTH